MRGWLVTLGALFGCDQLFGLEHVNLPLTDAPQADTAGSDAPINNGCADGQRDSFVDDRIYQTIAACSGGWQLPGVKQPRTNLVMCMESGDDGINQTGRECSVADLCAVGWHVCTGPAEVRLGLGTQPGCSSVSASAVFFITQVSGDTAARCNNLGSNDVFGCGTLGAGPPDASCIPLNQWSGDLCSGLTTGGWDCGFAQSLEASSVTKAESSGGGALCCKDP